MRSRHAARSSGAVARQTGRRSHGGVHRAVGVFRRAARDPADDLRGTRRVYRVDPALRADRLAIDEQRMLGAKRGAFGGEGIAHLLPVALQGEIRRRLVLEWSGHDRVGGSAGAASATEIAAGSRKSSAGEAWAVNFALRNPSLDVFSNSRRTRYAMPGSISPDRAVFAHAMTHLHERGFDRAGHAVEHLDLVPGRPDAQAFRARDRVGHAADVVRAKGGVNGRERLQHPPREALVVGVRLVLVQVHGDRPVALAGDHGFVVPISAFDQADRSTAGRAPRPSGSCARGRRPSRAGTPG